MIEITHHRPTVVLGGTGKTGRRLVQRLTRRDIPVRIGSRSSGLPFDWERPSTWRPVFQDATAAYTFVPDLAVANPTEAIAGLVEAALAAGTRRLVLLSGRGEEQAQACEKILMDSGADWTVLRASFFNQNFSESYLLDPVLAGEVMLPAGVVGEPFSDTDDIADVAATVLTEVGHVGEVYELTGPRPLTFAEATATIARGHRPGHRLYPYPARGVRRRSRRGWRPAGNHRLPRRPVRHRARRAQRRGCRRRRAGPGAAGADFADYTRVTAATGVWNPTDQPNPRSLR
jgi:nucleoside-diphosphate-sugar epimerase